MSRPISKEEKKTTLSLTFTQKNKDKLADISKIYGISQSEMLERLTEQEYDNLYAPKPRERTELDDIYDFFDDITSADGLTEEISQDGNTLELKLEGEPLVTVYPMNAMYYAASNFDTQVVNMTAGEVVAFIIDNLYQKAPFFFTDGTYVPKQNTKYTAIAEEFILALGMRDRINKIADVDAVILSPGYADIIRVQFKNGSALEYMLPTEQNPDGNFLYINVDDEHRAIDNDSFKAVYKILKFPSLLSKKPDGRSLPPRAFTVTSGTDFINKNRR